MLVVLRAMISKSCAMGYGGSAESDTQYTCKEINPIPHAYMYLPVSSDPVSFVGSQFPGREMRTSISSHSCPPRFKMWCGSSVALTKTEKVSMYPSAPITITV